MKRQRQEHSASFMSYASQVPEEGNEKMDQDTTPWAASSETSSTADASDKRMRMRLSLRGGRGGMHRQPEQLQQDGYHHMLELNAKTTTTTTQQSVPPQQSQNVVAQETTTPRTVAVAGATTSSLHRHLRSNFAGNGFDNPSHVVKSTYSLLPNIPPHSSLRTSAAATTTTISRTVKKPNRLPSTTSSGGGPPMQLSSACLLIPVCLAMWWYWTRKACQRVVKGLLRHTPEPTPATYSASSSPSSSNNNTNNNNNSNNQESSPEVGGQYHYVKWGDIDDADAPGNHKPSERLVKWIHAGDMKRRRQKQELRNVTRRIVYGGTSSLSAPTTTTANPTTSRSSSNYDTAGNAAVRSDGPHNSTSTQQQTPTFATIEMTSYDSSIPDDHSTNMTTTSLSPQAALLDQSLSHPMYQPPPQPPPSSSVSSPLPTESTSIPMTKEVVNADASTDASKQQNVPEVSDCLENSNDNAMDADTTKTLKWECLKDVAESMDLCTLRFDTSLVVATGNNDYRTIYNGKKDKYKHKVAAVSTPSQSAATCTTTPMMNETPIKSLLEDDNEGGDYDEEAKKAEGGLMT